MERPKERGELVLRIRRVICSNSKKKAAERLPLGRVRKKDIKSKYVKCVI